MVCLLPQLQANPTDGDQRSTLGSIPSQPRFLRRTPCGCFFRVDFLTSVGTITHKFCYRAENMSRKEIGEGKTLSEVYQKYVVL
jgi:hypothetical protein